MLAARPGSHAEALLADHESTFAVEGDLRDPAGILEMACVGVARKPPTGLPAYPQWPRATWTILTMTKIIAMAR